MAMENGSFYRPASLGKLKMFLAVLYSGNMTSAQLLVSSGKIFNHNDKGIKWWLALTINGSHLPLINN